MSEWDELSPLEIDNARLRAELAAERDRVTKLREALVETLAVATRNEEGDYADRARGVLKETK